MEDEGKCFQEMREEERGGVRGILATGVGELSALLVPETSVGPVLRNRAYCD